jgi:hypothetical protein
MKKKYNSSGVTTTEEERIKQEYARWCMELLEIQHVARKGYREFINKHELSFFDKPRYKQKGWIPFNEVKILAELKGISVAEARQLRNEFNDWIGAIQWSDPEKVTQKLVKLAAKQPLN